MTWSHAGVSLAKDLSCHTLPESVRYKLPFNATSVIVGLFIALIAGLAIGTQRTAI